ncbi:MAG: NINE protein [Xenococcaceae cyanobacterium]
MPVFRNLLSKPKSRKVAVIMALLGTVTPIAGLHKFYLGQPLWGVIYFLLWSTPIPRIACAIEAVWYLVQDSEQFNRQFNLDLVCEQSPRSISSGGIDPNQVGAIADALRQLDQLREDGLMSEYEFEQKRRQLLDRIA